jgi:uncharacterized protein (UPF0248 family)
MSIFLEGLKDDENHSSVDGINMIQDKEQLKVILRHFLESPGSLNKYLEHSDLYISARQYGIFENLKESWDSEIEELSFELFKLIIKDDFLPYHEREEFIRRLLRLLVRKKYGQVIGDYS